MNVLVIGANGQVGKHVVKNLAESNHEVTAMVRKEEQVDKLKKIGATNVVLADLEEDFSSAMDGVDSVIFAAGSGGDTGADKTIIVDLYGSIKAVDYAKDKGINRFVQLSSVGSANPDKQDDKIKHYMIAKGLADRHLQQTNLDYTIVRPGVLSNEEAKGKIKVSDEFTHFDLDDGSIPRADVAKILVEVLDRNNMYKKTFEVLHGDKDISEVLGSL